MEENTDDFIEWICPSCSRDFKLSPKDDKITVFMFCPKCKCKMVRKDTQVNSKEVKKNGKAKR